MHQEEDTGQDHHPTTCTVKMKHPPASRYGDIETNTAPQHYSVSLDGVNSTPPSKNVGIDGVTTENSQRANSTLASTNASSGTEVSSINPLRYPSDGRGIPSLNPPARKNLSATEELGIVEGLPPPNAMQFRRLLQADIVANLLLLNGACYFTGFTVRELMNGCQRDGVAFFLYGTFTASFFANGVIEYCIDYKWNRSVPMGRYTTIRWANQTITILFVLGVVGDFIAFIYWATGEEGVRTERIIQMVAHHLTFIASIIVIVTNLRTRPSSYQDKADLCGNLFFLWENTMLVCARYVSELNPVTDEEFVDVKEMNFEIVSGVFRVCNALCYLCGGAIRTRKDRTFGG